MALGGAVASADALKQIHQTMDTVAILKPVTKFSASVGAPHAVAEVVNNAFRAAEGGRPGAAFVSLPIDVMAAPAQAELLAPPLRSGLGPAPAEAMIEAARLISAADNPVVLLGLLASKPSSSEALQAFLTRNNLPVVGTFQAAGAVGRICSIILVDGLGSWQTSQPISCSILPISSSPSAMILSSIGPRSGTRARIARSSM